MSGPVETRRVARPNVPGCNCADCLRSREVEKRWADRSTRHRSAMDRAYRVQQWQFWGCIGLGLVAFAILVGIMVGGWAGAGI